MISRYVIPATGAVLLFVAALVIMLFAMPGELRPVDYFLSGTVATTGTATIGSGTLTLSGDPSLLGAPFFLGILLRQRSLVGL